MGKKKNSAKSYFWEVLVDAVSDKGRAAEQQVNVLTLAWLVKLPVQVTDQLLLPPFLSSETLCKISVNIKCVLNNKTTPNPLASFF